MKEARADMNGYHNVVDGLRDNVVGITTTRQHKQGYHVANMPSSAATLCIANQDVCHDGCLWIMLSYHGTISLELIH